MYTLNIFKVILFVKRELLFFIIEIWHYPVAIHCITKYLNFSMIYHIVNKELASSGKGYFESLVKRAEGVTSNDAALRQVFFFSLIKTIFFKIDLDVARTLPTNKLFDKAGSEKIQSLRRVLYAFRFHNLSVNYCQVKKKFVLYILYFLGIESCGRDSSFIFR